MPVETLPSSSIYSFLTSPLESTTSFDAIYITVKDNGNGMPETIIRQLEEIRENGILKEKEHIGIFNIQQRLLLLYGKEYGLTVEHVKPSGTAVTICIPKTKGEKGYESGNYR